MDMPPGKNWKLMATEMRFRDIKELFVLFPPVVLYKVAFLMTVTAVMKSSLSCGKRMQLEWNIFGLGVTWRCSALEKSSLQK